MLHSGDISDRGEAGVTMEIISLIDNNMKIQDNRHHSGGDNYAGIKIKCKFYYNEDSIFLSGYFPLCTNKSKNRNNIFLIDGKGAARTFLPGFQMN